LLRRVEEKVAQGGTPEDGPLTVAKYAAKWIREYKEMGITEWKNHESRLRLHVLPAIGDLIIAEVRPRHIAELFKNLRRKRRHAPKTIHNIYSAVQGLFREAEIEGAVDRSPCVLTSHHLGPMEDKDSGWRSTAVFNRAELQTLVFDERIPEDRRVLYALEGIAALRHGEAAGLRWHHYEPDLAPLGRLTIATSYNRGRTKTRRERFMPVRPTLAKTLEQWRLHGWVELMGREPRPDDLIVPAPTRRLFPAGRMRDKNYSRRGLMEDFAAVGLRHRRGHDLRRTMISLARSDGARKDLLETCTHTPKGGRTAIDLYTTFEWGALCAEVAKLRVGREGE
jgi:integrase